MYFWDLFTCRQVWIFANCHQQINKNIISIKLSNPACKPWVYTVPPARMVTSTRAYALKVNFVTRAYFFQNIHERLLFTRKYS